MSAVLEPSPRLAYGAEGLRAPRLTVERSRVAPGRRSRVTSRDLACPHERGAGFHGRKLPDVWPATSAGRALVPAECRVPHRLWQRRSYVRDAGPMRERGLRRLRTRVRPGRVAPAGRRTRVTARDATSVLRVRTPGYKGLYLAQYQAVPRGCAACARWWAPGRWAPRTMKSPTKQGTGDDGPAPLISDEALHSQGRDRRRERLRVHRAGHRGHRRHPQVLRASGTSVPSVLAAVLLAVRDQMPEPSPVYFELSERPPGENALRFLFAGAGDAPPLTHEVMRRVEPDPARRSLVHAGG